jgi:Na+-translocating ferredoxin:NAD+ oxidoreductase RnfD subunit
MAQFKDSAKAKDFVAKKPLIKQIQGFGHKVYPVLTIINTLILIYIIINK